MGLFPKDLRRPPYPRLRGHVDQRKIAAFAKQRSGVQIPPCPFPSFPGLRVAKHSGSGSGPLRRYEVAELRRELCGEIANLLRLLDQELDGSVKRPQQLGTLERVDERIRCEFQHILGEPIETPGVACFEPAAEAGER